MTASADALDLTQLAAQAAADKLGRDIVAFDVSEQLAITDVFLIVGAGSDRQVGAIVDGVEETLLKAGHKPVRREGERENRWVLLDYFEVVVHVQVAEERELYSLERLWRDCPRIELDLHQPPAEQDNGTGHEGAAPDDKAGSTPTTGGAMSDLTEAEQSWDEEGGGLDPEVDTDTPAPGALDHDQEEQLEEAEETWDDEGGGLNPDVDTDTPVPPSMR